MQPEPGALKVFALLKCSPAKWYLSMSNFLQSSQLFFAGTETRLSPLLLRSFQISPVPGTRRTHARTQMGDTHQAGAQAEDGGEVAPAVDVSAEKAVAHVDPLRPVALLRAQVHHRVRGGEEARVRCQIHVETFPERVDPVVKPQAGQVVVQAPPSPPVVQLVGERFSEVIHTERGDNFIR